MSRYCPRRGNDCSLDLASLRDLSSRTYRCPKRRHTTFPRSIKNDVWCEYQNSKTDKNSFRERNATHLSAERFSRPEFLLECLAILVIPNTRKVGVIVSRSPICGAGRGIGACFKPVFAVRATKWDVFNKFLLVFALDEERHA